MTYLLEDVSSGFARVKNEPEIQALLGEAPTPQVLCGHTHVQRLVRLSSGPIIVNPGSVGFPAFDDKEPVRHVIQSLSPNAKYAIIERSTVSFLQVEYDWNAAAKKARELSARRNLLASVQDVS